MKAEMRFLQDNTGTAQRRFSAETAGRLAHTHPKANISER